MTAHSEAMEAYRKRIGAVDKPAGIETVSEPEDPTAGMVRCIDCKALEDGWCTNASKALGIRKQRLEIGRILAKRSQHCAGFIAKKRA